MQVWFDALGGLVRIELFWLKWMWLSLNGFGDNHVISNHVLCWEHMFLFLVWRFVYLYFGTIIKRYLRICDLLLG